MVSLVQILGTEKVWVLLAEERRQVSAVTTHVAVCRFLESHWFVWATQMSHLPMPIDYDSHDNWVTTQLRASCNVEHSLFNDWWSGHLNFQIEHQSVYITVHHSCV